MDYVLMYAIARPSQATPYIVGATLAVALALAAGRKGRPLPPLTIAPCSFSSKTSPQICRPRQHQTILCRAWHMYVRTNSRLRYIELACQSAIQLRI